MKEKNKEIDKEINKEKDINMRENSSDNLNVPLLKDSEVYLDESNLTNEKEVMTDILCGISGNSSVKNIRKPYLHDDYPGNVFEDEISGTFINTIEDKHNYNNYLERFVSKYGIEKEYKTCNHFDEVTIGEYKITATGSFHLKENDKRLKDFDIIIPLHNSFGRNLEFGKLYVIWNAPLEDYGGVPLFWNKFVQKVANAMRSKKKLITFCQGGHGRTGTMLASLLAVLEPTIEDPVKEIKKRYCEKAVESYKQIEAVFSLKNEKPPEEYDYKKHTHFISSPYIGNNVISNKHNYYKPSNTATKIPVYNQGYGYDGGYEEKNDKNDKSITYFKKFSKKFYKNIKDKF